jgi:hypothetical protein
LSLWGLPESVIEGVAWHHRPSESGKPGFSTVLTTHVASICDELQNPCWLSDQTAIDTLYLEKIGYLDKQEKWKRTLHLAEMS